MSSPFDDPKLRDRVLRALGVIDERHLPGKHDQSAHGRKGPTGAAKAAAKKGAAEMVPVGHAAFADLESVTSVDQAIDVLRRHKAANPDVPTADLIRAADAAATAKYRHLDNFFARTLQGREDEIDQPTAVRPKPRDAPSPTQPPAPATYPVINARQAQDMQDGMPPPWTGDQRRSLRYYTGNSAVANGLLRGWITPPGRTATDRKKIEAGQRNIDGIRAAMRPTTQSVVVSRTANPEQFGVATAKELAGLVGHTLRERGFMSTTTKKRAGVGGSVRMEIEVPAGTPAAFVKSVSRYPYEDELVLDADLRYTIVSVSGPAGRPVVRLRVEPR